MFHDGFFLMCRLPPVCTRLYSSAASVGYKGQLEARAQTADPNALQPGAVRLFLVLLLIEAASLAVKYF